MTNRGSLKGLSWVACVALLGLPAAAQQADGDVLNPDRAAAKDEAELGAILRVQGVNLGPQAPHATLRVDVEVRNVSNRTITATWGFLTAQYGDRHQSRQVWSEDLLPDTIRAGMPGPQSPPPRTLKAGETLQMVVFLPPGADGSPPASVSAVPSAVVFEDRTELGHPAQIAMTFDRRRKDAGERLQLLEDLRAIRSNSKVVIANQAKAGLLPALQTAVADRLKAAAGGMEGANLMRAAMLHEFEQDLSRGVAPEVVFANLERREQTEQAVRTAEIAQGSRLKPR